MVSVDTLKREVAILHKALIVPAEDNTVLMRINGKEYTSKNIGEGNQAIIEFSRNYDRMYNK